MKDENRQKRHEAISEAAYTLLARYGYSGTSMLRVAKAAKASNETMYRWYGDKDGLFRQMVSDNADETRRILETALADQTDPLIALRRFAPIFLRMLLGRRAVLLNRVAASDPTGKLGAAVTVGGRHVVLPLVEKVIRQISEGSGYTSLEATQWFMALLIGDLQMRRIIGDIAMPTEEEIAARTEHAVNGLLRMLGKASM
ncbi:MAG: TetR/AcrR family transcriptional regulator [Paracoccus sp. (in: a-proteobacteria)]